MQVVILAGGYGTRLAEETDFIPKPMVRIGNLPILLHIMHYYASFGHTDFIIALGYKSEVVFDYFKINSNFKLLGWDVKLIDTGLDTSTGGRIKKIYEHLNPEFMLTYGDGLSSIDLNLLLKAHRREKRIATVSAVHPPARFGSLVVQNGLVTRFAEKDPQDTGWINGGFFCFQKAICDYLPDFSTPLESKPLNDLVADQQLTAYLHSGWWQPMDSLRDKRILEELWNSGSPPWKIS
jgi:glucose-1-phosphate cytidylyltransferase